MAEVEDINSLSILFAMAFVQPFIDTFVLTAAAMTETKIDSTGCEKSAQERPTTCSWKEKTLFTELEGERLGYCEGANEGDEGVSEGEWLGRREGEEVGAEDVGEREGYSVGEVDGLGEGCCVGSGEGRVVGVEEGSVEGAVVGIAEGKSVGVLEGDGLGTLVVGTAVGLLV